MVYTDKDDNSNKVVNEMMNIIKKDDKAILSMEDINLIVDDTDEGEKVASLLEKKNIKIVMGFSKEKGYADREKKLAFWKGRGEVKISTVHSFKGWEARITVINITKAKTQKDFAIIYTALTRIKKHPEGSILKIITTSEELINFSRTP